MKFIYYFQYLTQLKRKLVKTEVQISPQICLSKNITDTDIYRQSTNQRLGTFTASYASCNIYSIICLIKKLWFIIFNIIHNIRWHIFYYIIKNYGECRNVIGCTEKGLFPSILFPPCNILLGLVETNWQSLKKSRLMLPRIFYVKIFIFV